MGNAPKNHGKHWTEGDVDHLRELAKGNTPTRVIGLKLGRTPDAVKNKANEEDITLKPTNQPPYSRRK